MQQPVVSSDLHIENFVYGDGDASPEKDAGGCSPTTQAANDAAAKWINEQSDSAKAANQAYYSQLLHESLSVKETAEEKRKEELRIRREKVEALRAQVDEKVSKNEEKKQKAVEAENAAELWMIQQQKEEEKKQIWEDEMTKLRQKQAKEDANDAAAKWIASQLGGDDNNGNGNGKEDDEDDD